MYIYQWLSYFDETNSQRDNENWVCTKNQKKVEAAESDPSNTGPAETLREEAAQNTNENDSKEPA